MAYDLENLDYQSLFISVYFGYWLPCILQYVKCYDATCIIRPIIGLHITHYE